MKKYIFWSLLLHVGIATALISWSGISVSEWTQNLLNKVGIEKSRDETADLAEETLEKEPQKIEKNQIKKSVIVQKPKEIPVIKNKIKVKEQAVKKDTLNPQDKKISENSKTEDLEKTVKNEILQETEPEVQYNPQEDLTAIKQKDFESPSMVSVQKNSPESPSDNEIKMDLREENEFVSDRDFEEINTDPQELKKIIKDPQKEVKTSQALVPVPGNPEWAYPQQARNNKNEGSVFLQYFVDETGFVDKIQLLQSSGYSILDNEALRVMARQRYEPGQAGWYKHRVDFKLKNM